MSGIKGKAMLLFAVSALLLGGCTKEKEEQALYSTDLTAPQQANYKTVQVVKGDYVKSVSGDASLYYPEAAELFMETDHAYVREILVKKGQAVKKGDPLITFDIKTSNAAVQELILRQKRIREASEAEKDIRLQSIEDAKAASEHLEGYELEIALLEVEKLQTEYEEFLYLSEYQMAECSRSLEQMEQEMEEDTLEAPFDGVIDFVEPCSAGDHVEAGQVLVQIHAADKFYLSVQDTTGDLRYHMDVTIEAGKKGDTKAYTGKVVAAHNVLPSSVPDGRVLIRLEEAAAKEDLEVNLKYRCDTEKLQNVLLLDRTVADYEEEKTYVHILENEVEQKRFIVPGLRNMEYIWILEGLWEGQEIIAE